MDRCWYSIAKDDYYNLDGIIEIRTFTGSELFLVIYLYGWDQEKQKLIPVKTTITRSCKVQKIGYVEKLLFQHVKKISWQRTTEIQTQISGYDLGSKGIFLKLPVDIYSYNKINPLLLIALCLLLTPCCSLLFVYNFVLIIIDVFKKYILPGGMQ